MTRRSLIAIALVAFVVRAFVAIAVPIGVRPELANCAPDESQHFVAVAALASGRPTSWKEAHVPYAAYLPTNYVAQAGVLALARALGIHAQPCARHGRSAPELAQVVPARFGSVLLGVIACLLLALAATEWTGSADAGIFAGIFVALFPQFAFISGYVNGDAMTFAAGAGFLWALARWARRGEGSTALPGLGLATALVVLAKPTNYFLLPTTAAWVGFAAATRRIPPRALLRAAALALLSLPILIWNRIRNEGDWIGTHAFADVLAQLPNRALGHSTPGAWHSFVTILGRSSFAVFGNLDVNLPDWVYLVAAVLLCAGLALGARQLREANGVELRAATWMAASAALNLSLIAYHAWYVDFQPQGRYAATSVAMVGIASALLPRRRGWCAGVLIFLSLAAVYMCVVLVERPCKL